MGSLFAAKLSGVADVAVLTSWEARAEAVNTNGLFVEQATGVDRHEVPYIRSVADLTFPPHVILLCIKMPAFESALELVAGLTTNTYVAIQNGVAHIEILQSRFSNDQIVFAPTYQGATYVAPNRIRHGSNGDTILWTPGRARGERAMAEFGNLLRAANLHIRMDGNGLRDMWMKFIVTCGVNATAAVLRRRLSVLSSVAPARELTAAAINEAVSVASHHGIDIELEHALEHAKVTVAAAVDNSPSILQDLLAERPTEIEWINGYLVRLGERYRIPTPVNWTLTQAVRAASSSYDASVDSIAKCAARRE